MKKQHIMGAAILAFSLVGIGCASNGDNLYSKAKPAGIIVQDSALGKVLADQHGMTLYTFDKDTEGMSNCYGPCEQKWPPLHSKQAIDEMDFSTVVRKDGSLQVRYHNKPLYLWVGDKQAGDTTGDGVKDVWHVVPVAK